MTAALKGTRGNEDDYFSCGTNMRTALFRVLKIIRMMSVAW
jgi:hypothetical protein